jgi:basic membrane protein A and related proteins
MGFLKVFTRRKFLGSGAAGLLLPLQSKLAQAADALQVAAVFSSSVEKPWATRIHQAAEAAEARGEIAYYHAERVSILEIERVVRDYCKVGRKLIIVDAFAAEDIVRSVAAEFPDRAFLLGSAFKPDADANPNVAVFDASIQDASYLLGFLAGQMTKSGKIGLVGSFATPTANRLMNAFIAGAREARADAIFKVAFTSSWYDPPRVKEIALAQAAAGVDLFYSGSIGVAQAAKEKGLLVVSDGSEMQSDHPETVITSAQWNFEPTLAAAIALVNAGTFKADDYSVFSFLKSSGCSLAPFGAFDAKIPAEVKAKLAAKETAIKAGVFAVTVDESEPKSSV